MARRHRRKIDMEEALSLGDALSIRIIVFLLLVIFLVPLISIGKARIVKAKTDHLWPKVARYISEHQTSPPTSYLVSLELPENAHFITTKKGLFTWIESYNPLDSTLYIARHNHNSGQVRILRIERFGTVPLLNQNQLSWSPMESLWYSNGTNEVLVTDSQSQNFIRDYKEFILKGRSFK